MSGLLFGGLFWGILIIVIGISIVMKHAFNIDFHLVRIFFGIIIILFGVKMITGWGGKPHSKGKDIGIVRINDNNGDYDVVFSDTTLDLTNEILNNNVPKEINVVFGSARILVPDSINLDISTTTVFGYTELPNRSNAGFGGGHYKIGSDNQKPTYRIETNTIFGSLIFEVVSSAENLKSTLKPDTTTIKEDDSF
jgi:predicted membrane protein